jgi:hypothetical protein
MKKLLVAAGLALALTAPSSANDMDKAVARSVVFTMFCGELPAKVQEQTKAYLVDHQQQVASESKVILDERLASGTDQKKWCRLMRSQIGLR